MPGWQIEGLIGGRTTRFCGRSWPPVVRSTVAWTAEGRLRDLAHQRHHFGYRRLHGCTCCCGATARRRAATRSTGCIGPKVSRCASARPGDVPWASGRRSCLRCWQTRAGRSTSCTTSSPADGASGSSTWWRDTRVPARGCRHVDLRQARGPRSDGARGAAWQTADDRLRQWHGVHLERRPRDVPPIFSSILKESFPAS